MATLITGSGISGYSGPILGLETECLFAQVFVAPNHFVIDNLRLSFQSWPGIYEGVIEVKFYNVDENNRPSGIAVVSDTDTFHFDGNVTLPRAYSLILPISSGYAFTQDDTFIFTVRAILETYTGAFNQLRIDVWPYYVLGSPAEMIQSFDDGDSWEDQIVWSGFTGPADLAFLINGDIVPFGSVPPVSPFPPDRPVMDIPDPWWDPPDPPVPTTPPGPLPPFWAAGGGSYQKNLVVAGNQKIYYEPHAANTVRYTV